jgi:hypothetical protein
MDVVNVETELAADGSGVRGAVTLTNFTPRARALELFLELAPELFATATFSPAPDGTEAPLGRAWWTLPTLPPHGRTQVALAFPPKTDVEANDLDWYVAGIDESHVLGADPLPGDWDVRLPRTIVEAAEAAAAEPSTTPEEEVDYDAAEASAGVRDDE